MSSPAADGSADVPSPPGSPRRDGPVRVLVVEPDRRVRRSLGSLFGVCDDLEVIGSSADAGDAIDLFRHARPDVVILDPLIPDLEVGLALIGTFRHLDPTARILLLGWPGGSEEPVPDGDAVRVLGRSADPVELVAAICEGRSGEVGRC